MKKNELHGIHIHFIGIGGIGISALAQFCQSHGAVCTGSEMQETAILKRLREFNITIFIPQKTENLPEKCDLVIYTEAIPEENPEWQEARKRNIPMKSYFAFLGEISKHYKTIAVAGTHGKTTTTGLLASGFLTADFDATIFVGSTVKELTGANFHLGSNEYLLVEACEYRNSFGSLSPEIVILTNIELDHIDYYEDEAHYLNTFRDFCKKAKTVIYHEKDAKAHEVLDRYTGTKISVSKKDIQQVPPLNIMGNHNRENASLAITCAKHLPLDLQAFQKGLQNFTGAGRRQEFLGEWEGIKIFDDYGHHPTEIRATVAAFRDQFPKAKIGLIFEPHQYSRTRLFFDDFLSVFSETDKTAIFPIYAARDTEADKASISRDDFLKRNSKLQKVSDETEVKTFLKTFAPGDVAIFMGAGKISEFARNFMVQTP